MKSLNSRTVALVIYSCVCLTDTCNSWFGKNPSNEELNVVIACDSGDPIKFKENKPDAPMLNVKLNDQINLTIHQFNVPNDFHHFELKNLVQYRGTNLSDEDINGIHLYPSNKIKYTESMNITINKESFSQSLHISLLNSSRNLKKELYKLSFIPGRNNKIYDVTYSVDWKTGRDDYNITFKEFKTSHSGVESDSNLNSPVPDSSTDDKAKQTDGELNIPMVVGIIAVILIALVASWTFWKCRNKKKQEPFYCEVQYAELQLNQTNTAPPNTNYATYTQIKGVIVPKTNVASIVAQEQVHSSSQAATAVVQRKELSLRA